MTINELNINELYEQLLNEIDVGIHVINEKGKTIIYNKKMMEIESMKSEDVLDKDLLDVFTFGKNQRSTLVEALRGKTAKRVKQTYFNYKGKEITTINDSFPIIRNGNIAGAIEIAKDVTQLEQVIKENVLQKQNTKFTFDLMIGKNVAFREMIEEAKKATRTASSVLIVGETGTGKELIAQSIHNGSSRSPAPFISQNCAAIPDNLMESLLFGTKKGAFTGALDRPGLFEQADGGTLLLDEINSLNPPLQAKLLRAIQEKTIRRVGDTKDKMVDVRIIATINEDPIDAVSQNRLRRDLYYRLSVVSLFIPPLRDRKDDLMLLAGSFIEKYNSLFHMNVKSLNEEVKHLLYDHDWPGNVRELEHIIEGTMNLVVDEETITVSKLPFRFRNQARKTDSPADIGIQIAQTEFQTKTLKEKIREVERHYIQQILEESNHNISKAAKKLGLSRQSLQYRLKKFK
ncbi:arginine utilization regulatory protein [Scopulibacillus darangshiensis]|uniref:Arginine utilization regulatory protein n=1 Tax=Scopulibacillus darangshiensis TaxID=442528 RepID=A0A4R2P6Z0_9BACL|nr:sigma 54-interacting transcriptional regulator [Scopulibacillus darangshiensis]TCP30642.1 arginine utilization regulatory protein [Scopulibacillus darangshiensis]